MRILVLGSLLSIVCAQNCAGEPVQTASEVRVAATKGAMAGAKAGHVVSRSSKSRQPGVEVDIPDDPTKRDEAHADAWRRAVEAHNRAEAQRHINTRAGNSLESASEVAGSRR